MMSSVEASGDMTVWGRGPQRPDPSQTSTNPQVGFVSPKLVKEAVWVGREKPSRGLCCGFHSAGRETRVISSDCSVDALRPHPRRGAGDCWKSTPLPTVPQKWALVSGPRPQLSPHSSS